MRIAWVTLSSFYIRFMPEVEGLENKCSVDKNKGNGLLL
jgi:hypothetical protein